MKKYEFTKGEGHVQCENGIICNKCAWIMVKNGQIDAYEFCLEKIIGAKITGECSHGSREKCSTERGEHAEMQRFIFRHNKHLEDLEKIIICRLNQV